MTHKNVWVSRLMLFIALASTANATRMLQRSLQSEIEQRTIGGVATQVGEFPYMLSIRFPQGSRLNNQDVGGRHMCGGVLIEKNIVLTAGHCLKPNGIRNPDVHLGRFNREGDDQGRFQAFRTIDTRIHPQFEFVTSTGWSSYDVALLVLEGESQASPIGYVRHEGGLSSGNRGVVLGWGYTRAQDSTSQSDTLLKVDVPIVSRNECRNVNGYASLIRQTMVCAGEEGKDACQFDSGGPLLMNGQVAGIVSWGPELCGGTRPGVYASVGALSDWIEREIQAIRGQGCSFLAGRWIPAGCNN